MDWIKGMLGMGAREPGENGVTESRERGRGGAKPRSGNQSTGRRPRTRSQSRHPRNRMDTEPTTNAGGGILDDGSDREEEKEPVRSYSPSFYGEIEKLTFFSTIVIKQAEVPLYNYMRETIQVHYDELRLENLPEEQRLPFACKEAVRSVLVRLDEEYVEQDPEELKEIEEEEARQEEDEKKNKAILAEADQSFKESLKGLDGVLAGGSSPPATPKDTRKRRKANSQSTEYVAKDIQETVIYDDASTVQGSFSSANTSGAKRPPPISTKNENGEDRVNEDGDGNRTTGTGKRKKVSPTSSPDLDSKTPKRSKRQKGTHNKGPPK